MKIVNVKIGELFSKLNLLNIEYETAHTNNDDIFIRTPTGDFTKISAFVRKNAPAIRVKTECNKTLIAATNHIVISDKGEEYLKDASTILTIEGSYETDNKFDKIISKEFLGNRDLYDISIPNPHLYVDVNGFIHHNTTLAKALCNEIGVDYIVINGSLDNGIDILRTKILSFASTISLTDAKKVVIIDEADYLNCLWEEETILTGTLDYPVPIKLKDLDENKEIPLISFNMDTGTFENDLGWIVADSINDVYEVELDSGEKLCVTDDHPFIIKVDDEYTEKCINDGLLGRRVVLFNQIPSMVVATNYIGPKRVINLAVNKNQNFVSGNGIVVHNCNSIQPALRNFMEEFSDNCTFILTCNYKDRIIAPLHSRCAVIDFQIPSNERVELAKQFFKRVLYILKQEHIEYDQKVVAELVQKHLPDYRRILNELQRYAASGKIDTGILLNLGNESFKELFGFLQVKNFTETRKWVAKNADTNSDQIFRTLYDQGHNYIKKESLPQLILILADYSYKKAFVADQELNLMACLVEIMVAVEFL